MLLQHFDFGVHNPDNLRHLRADIPDLYTDQIKIVHRLVIIMRFEMPDPPAGNHIGEQIIVIALRQFKMKALLFQRIDFFDKIHLTHNPGHLPAFYCSFALFSRRVYSRCFHISHSPLFCHMVL